MSRLDGLPGFDDWLTREPDYLLPDETEPTAAEQRADWLDSIQQKHGHINTHHIFPPIPIRSFDWSAMRDDDEGEEGRPVGYGATEDEALRDLIEQLEDE